jgi:hypothetical protein
LAYKRKSDLSLLHKAFLLSPLKTGIRGENGLRRKIKTSTVRVRVRNMKQELIEIAKQGQIDQITAKRLAACSDFEFKSSPVRYFDARKVIIVSGASELLSIRISGFGKSFKGRQLICSNIDNPEKLEVNMAESEMVLQSIKDPNVFCVKSGETSVTGPKYSEVTKDLDASAEVLKIIPRKDPDIVQIDSHIYRQTGTVFIGGPFYFVVLER